MQLQQYVSCQRHSKTTRSEKAMVCFCPYAWSVFIPRSKISTLFYFRSDMGTNSGNERIGRRTNLVFLAETTKGVFDIRRFPLIKWTCPFHSRPLPSRHWRYCTSATSLKWKACITCFHTPSICFASLFYISSPLARIASAAIRFSCCTNTLVVFDKRICAGAGL